LGERVEVLGAKQSKMSVSWAACSRITPHQQSDRGFFLRKIGIGDISEALFRSLLILLIECVSLASTG